MRTTAHHLGLCAIVALGLPAIAGCPGGAKGKPGPRQDAYARPYRPGKVLQRPAAVVVLIDFTVSSGLEGLRTGLWLAEGLPYALPRGSRYYVLRVDAHSGDGGNRLCDNLLPTGTCRAPLDLELLEARRRIRETLAQVPTEPCPDPGTDYCRALEAAARLLTAAPNGAGKRIVVVGDLLMQETVRGTLNVVRTPFPPSTSATLVQIETEADTMDAALGSMETELQRRQVSHIRQVLEADVFAPGTEVLEEGDPHA